MHGRTEIGAEQGESVNMARSRCRLLSAMTFAGVVLFLLVIAVLHLLQRDYDPSVQYMSELVFGRFGGFLVVAFLGLALASISFAGCLRMHGSPVVVTFLPGLAGVCFLGAGLVSLATSAIIHIMFIAVAFVLCGLAMYLLPRTVVAFSSIGGYVVSWGALASMALATVLGGDLLSPGIAQRIAAASLLWWLLWACARTSR